MDTVLIVDDIEMNRSILKKALYDDYQILEAEDGEEAIRMVASNLKTISIILLDLNMPKMDGFQVMEILKKKNAMKYIPIILITGDTNDKVKQKGYELGAVEYITKPFHVDVIRNCVKNCIDIYQEKNSLEAITITQNRELKHQAERLLKLNSNIMDMMGTIVEFRGMESPKHIKRVKQFTHIMAECVATYYKEYDMTPEKIDMITAASSMHDVGKIVIPDSILLKPGKLTGDEFEVMKSHTTRGNEILDAVAEYQEESYRDYCAEICRYHHERYDGKGYPEGLRGDDIPISAQIVSIVEAFDTLISNRVYKAAVSIDTAMNMILEGECGVFSPKILECFRICKKRILKVVEENPEKPLESI